MVICVHEIQEICNFFDRLEFGYLLVMTGGTWIQSSNIMNHIRLESVSTAPPVKWMMT